MKLHYLDKYIKSILFVVLTITTIFSYSFLFIYHQSPKERHEVMATNILYKYIVITATIAPTPKATVTPITSAENLSDILPTISATNVFIVEINEYRKSFGLIPFIVEDESCAFASIRAKELESDFSHSGFDNRKIQGTIPYSNWNSVVENIANTAFGNPVEMWINSPAHDANLKADMKYACVSRNGNYYVFEAWR